MGFVNCQYALLSRLTFYKSRSGSSKGLSSTGIGVCFIKDLTFFVKSNSNVSLNLSIDIGDQKISHNSINLKDPIKRIVVLLIGHESLSVYRKYANLFFE